MSLANKIQKILEDKKAIDIVTIETTNKNPLADYFIIATGTSSTHVKALSDNIEKALKEEKTYPNKIEGYETGTWVLLDYFEVVVNIFTQEERDKYKLEEILQKGQHQD